MFTINLQVNGNRVSNIRNISCWKQSRAGCKSTPQQRQGQSLGTSSVIGSSSFNHRQFQFWKANVAESLECGSGVLLPRLSASSATQPGHCACLMHLQAQKTLGWPLLSSQSKQLLLSLFLLPASTSGWQLMCQATPSRGGYSHMLWGKLWLMAWIPTGILLIF